MSDRKKSTVTFIMEQNDILYNKPEYIETVTITDFIASDTKVYCRIWAEG